MKRDANIEGIVRDKKLAGNIEVYYYAALCSNGIIMD